MEILIVGLVVLITTGLISFASRLQREARKPREFGQSFLELCGSPKGLSLELSESWDEDRPVTHILVTSQSIPRSLTLGKEGVLSSFLEGADLRLNDEAFDRAVRIQARETYAFALMNRKMRGLVQDLVLRLNGSVKEREVRLVAPGHTDDPATLGPSIEQAIYVALGLSLETEDTAKRLAANAAGDDSTPVRLKNLQLLIEHFPNSPTTHEACIRAVQDIKPDMRFGGAVFLRDFDVISAIARDTKASESLRATALRYLFEKAPVELGIPVLEAVLRAPSGAVTDVAIEGVGRLRHKPSTKRLIELVDSSKPTRNAAIANALGRIGESETEPTLLDLLGHSDEDTRIAATRALGLVGSISSVETLLTLMKGLRETELKRAAREAIQQIQSRLGDAEAGRLGLADTTSTEGALSFLTEGGGLAIAGETAPGELCEKESGASSDGAETPLRARKDTLDVV